MNEALANLREGEWLPRFPQGTRNCTSSLTMNSPLNPTTGYCYASLLQTSARTRNVGFGRSIHAQVIKQGLFASIYVLNNLLNMYVKSGLASTAHHLLDEMPVKNACSWNTLVSGYAKEGVMEAAELIFKQIPDPDSVSYTAMVVGYNKMGDYKKGLRMFLDMIHKDVLPTEFTLTSILSSCAITRSLCIGKKVHSFIVKQGLGSYITVANSLINMNAKAGDSVKATTVFDGMSVRNVSSWNSLILLNMQSGQFDRAHAQFEQMAERDIVSWNTMITGYKQKGLDNKALEVFSEMVKISSSSPDKFALATVLSACANIESLKLGKEIHGHMIRTEFDAIGAVENSLISMYVKCGGIGSAKTILVKNGFSNLNVIAFTALLDGYVKLGDISPAREIFDSLVNRDVVAWTAMIVGYEQNGLNYDALALFRLMLKEGPRPNNYTFASILSVISSMTSLDCGKQIHSMAIRLGEELSVSVSNSLISMYAKAGSIADARQVFSLARSYRDTISWTSMILAFAQHGLGEAAIDLFEEMLSLNIKPDHITYVGVLVACTHVGLVEKGKSYYNLMQNFHKLTQFLATILAWLTFSDVLVYYTKLMILSRKCLLNLTTLLGVPFYQLVSHQKNVDLAEIAAKKLLLIDPENSGAFAVLANLYSVCGKWAEAAEVRKSMKEQGIKKDQGLSWFELKNGTHVFAAGDTLHPQRDAVYAKMANIWEDIKMGFIPDTGSVPHDLDEEVKEQILKHHSEKLAIAFGLVNTPEHTTLRIMKNLRVCNDCHTAIKFISKLVGREIIVRDATRFHHFKGGVCSCKDYW